ncbi:MAG: Gx transporter family protein [Tissierellia bacterium]|nr:Gx transporter family protein [Tissierellia bacterium]
MKNTRKLIFLSLLVAIGLGLGLVESMMPLPFVAPGAKLGLSNMVILITLVVFSPKDAFVVGILKSIVLTLVTGSVTSLFYSLSGSVLSCLAMTIVYKYFSNIFSSIGVSIFGAMTHNFVQVLVACLMMNNFRIFSYLPILQLTSIFTGYFVGLTSKYAVNNLRKSFNKFDVSH